MDETASAAMNDLGYMTVFSRIVTQKDAVG